MNEQDKIYGLMEQAEDLQTHAQNLQKSAQETFKELPLAVSEASREIRKRGHLQGLYVLTLSVAVGIVVAALLFGALYWITDSTRAEYARLRQEVAILEKNAQEFENRAGKANLTTCNDDGTSRLCIQVDTKIRYGDDKDFMIIKGY